MQEHKQWLLFAQTDLRLAKIALKSEDDLVIGGILYHCQQCIEKSLKAYLSYKDVELEKTHDLIKLVKLCSTKDLEFLFILNDAIEINPYAIRTRYPDNAFLMPDTSTAEWAVDRATYIFEFVQNKID